MLKPIDDTRMFEKLGSSLAEAGNYEVYIIGFPSKKMPVEVDSIHFFPLSKFSRMSFPRLAAPFKILKLSFQVKPDVLIVNTHELLIVGILNRILFGTRIVYDIQENYWRNILHTNAFPWPLRWLLAVWVRLKEAVTSPLFQWNFLAEKGYEKELRFLSNRYTVLENKVRLPKGFKRTNNSAKIKLLFSGTLAESTGVFEGIHLAKTLYQKEPTIELKIVGYCALPHTLREIKKAIEGYPFITLIGGDELVPHDQLLDAMAESDFGLISYRLAKHIENSVPTKLYEYLGCHLPILLQDYPPWTEICEPYQAAVIVNYSKPDIDLILLQMKALKFYTKLPEDVTWETEEPKLLKAIAGLC